MNSVITFAILLGTPLETCLAATCGDVPDTDGCSAWDIIPYKNAFSSLCDRHDVCYSCGAVFGVRREDCDLALLFDLENYCQSRDCFSWAKKYYWAVRKFGGRHYKFPSPIWCTQDTWITLVRTCLPQF